MIGYLKGIVRSMEPGELLVDVSGVGYAVGVPASILTRRKLGDPIELFVHTNVREGAIELFGFEDGWEKRAFLLLISVSGIGPRTALGMISALDSRQILSAIAKQDRTTLTSAPGVGKKTAERLLVELGDKAAELLSELAGSAGIGRDPSRREAGGRARHAPGGPDCWADALEALVQLGYREADAARALEASAEELASQSTAITLEGLVRTCLKRLAATSRLDSVSLGGGR